MFTIKEAYINKYNTKNFAYILVYCMIFVMIFKCSEIISHHLKQNMSKLCKHVKLNTFCK